MRQVVLDTETTGLEVEQGHRIIEIGCIEISGRRITERVFHHYLNPEREIDAGAQQVHGISLDMLRDKPRFSQIVDELLAFISGAELLIHNADFDVGFLDRELELAGRSERVRDICTVTDTWQLARAMHPGQKNSLDALCRRYDVDNSGRDLHGALLDARLLAEVYLAMTGGQTDLALGSDEQADGGHVPEALRELMERASGRELVVVRADAAERERHARQLDAIREKAGRCLWDAVETPPESGARH